MKGYAVAKVDGNSYAFWQARLRDEMPHSDEHLGNPMLWWAEDMETHDMIVCGYKTKREMMKEVKDYFADSDDLDDLNEWQLFDDV